MPESLLDKDGVRLVTDGPVGTVTLCVPEKRNAQSPAMWRALTEAGRLLPGDVRVVVLRAEGSSFSAGLDRQAFTPEGFDGEPSFLDLARGERRGAGRGDRRVPGGLHLVAPQRRGQRGGRAGARHRGGLPARPGAVTCGCAPTTCSSPCARPASAWCPTWPAPTRWCTWWATPAPWRSAPPAGSCVPRKRERCGLANLVVPAARAGRRGHRPGRGAARRARATPSWRPRRCCRRRLARVRGAACRGTRGAGPPAARPGRARRVSSGSRSGRSTAVTTAATVTGPPVRPLHGGCARPHGRCVPRPAPVGFRPRRSPPARGGRAASLEHGRQRAAEHRGEPEHPGHRDGGPRRAGRPAPPRRSPGGAASAGAAGAGREPGRGRRPRPAAASHAGPRPRRAARAVRRPRPSARSAARRPPPGGPPPAASAHRASSRTGPCGSALGGAGTGPGLRPPWPRRRSADSSTRSPATGPSARRSTSAAACSAIQVPSSAGPSGSSRPMPSRCRTACVNRSVAIVRTPIEVRRGARPSGCVCTRRERPCPPSVDRDTEWHGAPTLGKGCMT